MSADTEEPDEATLSPTAWANQLAERIEEGEVDPNEVDPVRIANDPDKVITPRLVELLSDEQVEAFNEAQKERMEVDIQERNRELSQEQQERLAIIESATQPDDEPLIETVSFGDHDLTVRTRISGAIERKLARLAEYEQQELTGVDDHDAIVELAIDVISELIQDEGWRDRDVWRAYYNRHGSEGLLDVTELVAEPARQRREQVADSFRGGRRVGGPGDV